MSGDRLRKQHIADLAVFGGPASFDETLHVGRPNIGDRDVLIRRIEGILDRNILTNHGPVVREFEERIADIAGVRHAIAVVNATSGIEITARALGLENEVIVPSFTFVGTVHALAWLGLQPVFCDIRPDSPTIDAAMAARLVGARTSAIMGVHLWGHVCDVTTLEAIGSAHGLPVVYDAAHAFAGSLDGRSIGSFGAAEVFSFHATKFINSFEGGAICTDDDELAYRVGRMVNFGFEGPDRTVMGGTNAKMSEVSAAMGLTSLDALPRILATNHANAATYSEHLAGLDGIRLLDDDPDVATNAQYIVLRVHPSEAALTRDELLRLLRAENVRARRYFFPGAHRLEPYVKQPALVREPLVNTETLAADVLVLPTGTALDSEAIEQLCEIIRFSLGHGPEIRRRLQAIDD